MKEHSIDKLFADKMKEHAVEPSIGAAELFQKRLAERQLDELFATKLKKHEVQPSLMANKLFQERMNEKQTPKGFFIGANRNYYWAAAASIVFMLGIGWWNLQPTHQTSVSSPVLAAAQPTIQPTEEIITITTAESPKVLENTVVNQKNIEKKAERVENKNVATNNQNTTETPVFKPMVLDEPIMDKLTLAVLDAQKERSKEEQKKRKEGIAEGPQFKKSASETIIVISDIKPSEEQLIIPELNADSRVTLAQATKIGKERMNNDRSFIAKVFTEIQHLKHGEKLDVAGINTKSESAFARADEGFIASEKQEISYRIEKIKGIFAKNTSN